MCSKMAQVELAWYAPLQFSVASPGFIIRAVLRVAAFDSSPRGRGWSANFSSSSPEAFLSPEHFIPLLYGC